MSAVSASTDGDNRQGIGSSPRRNEDRRFLDGKGEYVADIRVPGMSEAVFLRSPIAHGRIRSVEVPPEHQGKVFFAADIAFAKPIVAASAAPNFQRSDYPPLAIDKVRFVGDIVAICIAPTRAEAEDIAQACVIDFEELPPIWDIDVALAPDAPLIHDHWTNNLYVETRIETVTASEWSLAGATLTDVVMDRVSASSLTATDSRWRTVEWRAGRVATLDAVRATWDGVRVVGVRFDYANFASARLTDVLFID